MKAKSLILSLIAMGLMVFGYQNSQSQERLDQTPVTEKNGTFNTIIGNGGIRCLSGDDGYYRLYIPFRFYYDGMSISYISAGTNGYCTLNWSTTSYSSTPGYYYGFYQTVAWNSYDLYVVGGVYYKIEGSPGSYVLTYEWNNTQWYSPRTGNMNAQIKFYEGSNKIEIIYGPMNVGGRSYSTGIFFAGRRYAYYSMMWNIDPYQYGTSRFYWSPQGSSAYSGRYYNTGTETQNLYLGKTYVLGKADPELVGLLPSTGKSEQPYIMKSGYKYPWNGSHPDSSHPAVMINRSSDMKPVTITYQIAGPGSPQNPLYQVIYEALDPFTGQVDITPPVSGSPWRIQPVNVNDQTPGAYYFSMARGPAAAIDGSLDLQTNNIPGGRYSINATMVFADGEVQEWQDYFQIALERDVALSSIKSPKSLDQMKYPFSATKVAVQVNASNVGIFGVKSFGVNAYIFDESGQNIYFDSVFYQHPTDYLRIGDKTVIDQFRDFRPLAVGNYRMRFEAPVNGVTSYDLEANPLQRYVGDQDPSNNAMPIAAEEYWFRVAHEIEAQSDTIIQPGNEIYVGRPVRPSAIFSNQGVGDISNAPARMWITNHLGDTVYYADVIIQDIPQGRVNTSYVMFDNIFVAPAAGVYTACIEINENNDPVSENNLYCKTFEVIEALAGIYTIGSKNLSGNKNFPTFESALDELYLRGMTGKVEFHLTDAVYEVGDLINNSPALDISSKITGLNAANTITFRPSPERRNARAAVQVNMYSGSGIGIKIGQEVAPMNMFAPVYTVTDQSKKNYANTPGYIIFDGGAQKSLKVTLQSTIPFRAPFYLGKGASNITIKNVIIDGTAGTPSYTSRLPYTKYNVSQRAFVYEDDWDPVRGSFSSGIVIRNTPPFNPKFESNYYRLDTLRNMDIRIENNEISGFGFGIVSLGIGVLYLDYDNEGNPVGFTKYYNEHNSYQNNIISNVGRAGIFLGYEKNSIVSGNRIYEVTGNGSADAAGIVLGGEASALGSGYNNIGIEVKGNEISGVKAAGGIAYGIKAAQFRTSYPDGNKFVYFPDEDENLLLVNNIIWGLSPAGNEDAHRCGIYLTTSRDYRIADEMARFLNPLDKKYLSSGDKIANNTVIISSDGNIDNIGLTAGIGVQQSKNAEIFNNAILFEDRSFSEDSPVTAGIFFEGMMPGENSWISNRNAIYTANSGAAFYRFIEADINNEIVELGSRNEFMNIEQWRVWTGQDINSVADDFSADYKKTGIEPYRYRINEFPLPPKGSVLNNRGERLSYITKDIDGITRGQAGDRYDIGAVEFTGRMYINDVEMTSINAPASYRSGDGLFNDAEYIMTVAPVNINAIIRNNGSLQQSDIDVYLEIFRELKTGGFDYNNPVLVDSLKSSVASMESGNVLFNLSDDSGPKFFPKPYCEFTGYNVPDIFTTMTPNVTPVYRVRVRVESDEHNYNNEMEKDLRFYLMRSPVRLLVSTESSSKDLDQVLSAPPSKDDIAGRLNMDSLLKGIRYLGWFTDTRLERYDIDLFDRGSWEPRSVNYTMYRSMFWSDGDDSDPNSTLGRYQRMDIEDFLSFSKTGDKKNLIIGSQELVREQTDQNDPNYAPEFISRTLRAVNIKPGNPLGEGVSNDGNTVKGNVIGTDLTETIRSTGYLLEYTDVSGSHTITDEEPYPALIGISPTGPGFARPAYYYGSYSGSDSIMGIATISQSTNIVYLGLDWRHWGNIERVLRSVLDFVEKNGGVIIPVELADFKARAVGKSAQLNWETASEFGSARFEIERARINEAGRSEFKSIADVAAAVESATARDYSYRDFGVDYGKSYSYRLKMVDADGNYEYSGERTVTIGDSEAMFNVSEAMPNPARDEASFRITSSTELRIDALLYDMSGRIVAEISNYSAIGAGDMKIDLKELSSGSYQLVLSSGGMIVTRNITVVK